MTTCSTNTCGIGGWGGPLPGDPDNNVTLTATAVFNGINVAWSYPGTNPFAVAHVLLYRATSSDFNMAIQVATVGGSVYFDQISVSTPTEYFYWIKIVSVNGTVGELIGPASATATSKTDEIIEGLTGLIDQGVLAQSLKTEIDRITLNYNELTEEIANRIAGNAALSAALADVQNGLAQSLSFVNQEIILRQDGDSALATQLNTVAAVNAQNAAAILSEQTARVDADSALSTSITTVAATAGSKNRTYSQAAAPTGNLVAGDIWFDTDDNRKAYRYSGTAWVATDDARIASTAAALTTEQTARANGDSALASEITTAQSTLNANIASVQTTLQTNINTVDGKVTAIGALYTAKVSVNGLVGGFGVYNNGVEVEAGFDVDRFWIGRTSANKRKPFIVQNDVVYIDQAVINELTFTKLRDSTGGFLVENGKLKAQYVIAGELTANVVNTNNIVGAAVTSSYIVVSGGGTASATVSVPAGTQGITIVCGLGRASSDGGKSGAITGPSSGTLYVDGVAVATGSAVLVYAIQSPAASSYTILAARGGGTSFLDSMNLTVLVSKR